jgi:heterodisulfide reductase subunit A
MRTPGKGYEEFYQRLLKEGTHFVRGKVAEVSDFARVPEEEGKLIIQVEDTLIGKQRRIPVDMVVLSAGLQPRHDAKEVGKLFGISCSSDGWYIERHPKLDPVATMTDGVFIAGACQGPKDIPASVAQGSAAAARVLSIIGQKEIQIEAATAIVDEENCVGCQQCVSACPYQAITYLVDKGKALVNEALCKGCGTCVGTCLPKCISLKHFTDEQLVAEMLGAMQTMKDLESISVEVTA